MFRRASGPRCWEMETPAVTRGPSGLGVTPRLRHRCILAEPAEKGQKPHSRGKRLEESHRTFVGESLGECVWLHSFQCFPSVSVHTMASCSGNPLWEPGCPQRRMTDKACLARPPAPQSCWEMKWHSSQARALGSRKHGAGVRLVIQQRWADKLAFL